MTATIVPLDCIDIEQINNAFIWSACRYLAEATVNGTRGEVGGEEHETMLRTRRALAARLSALDYEAEPLRRVIR